MSKLEDALAWQIKVCRLPKPEREYKFLDGRRFRFDFAWPDRLPLVAVELEGGVYSNGRHVRGAGYENDCEKYSLAALDGWIVLRGTAKHVKNGQLIRWIEQALNLRGR